MKIWMVTSDADRSHILALFVHKEDAEAFRKLLPFKTVICSRTAFYGQPPVQGFNP